MKFTQLFLEVYSYVIQKKLKATLDLLAPYQRRPVSRTNEGRTSGLLSALPLVHHHFDFSSVEFCDSLALWYPRSCLRGPSVCNGCGASFSLCHALDCRKGGLVTQHHNEIRDALGDLFATGYKEVLKEPIVREADDSTNTPALVTDLRVRGVRQPCTDCSSARCACG